ncbi:MAG: CvpA family protein [Chromatiaceae bacterium]|nr:CvpA family protein [Gammaproteobacteria bacterium]MCP5306829.1 CvpA family protein [Chromatiaceae bacterium]MCP5316132.1 CvpA family protein [Chromatiaceae bacterium]
MVWLDFLILGIILVSTLISLVRGFVREAFSLAVWVLAFWVSWSFFRDLEVPLRQWIGSPTARLGIAFGALMIATLIVGGLVNYLIIQLVERTGMSGTDRFIGMIFGAARGVLVVAILVLLAGLTPLPQEGWWLQSSLVGYFEELAFWMRELLPPELADRFRYTV